MARSIWQQYIQDSNGRPRSGAVITAKVSETQVAAEIFTEKEGGAPVASVSSASTGRAFFWIEPGTYDITATYGADVGTQVEVEIGPALRLSDATFNSVRTNTHLRGNVVDVVIEGGILEIDWSAATTYRITIDDDCTVNFVGMSESEENVQAIYLDITVVGGPHAVLLDSDFGTERPDATDLSLAADSRNFYIASTNDAATIVIVPVKELVPTS